MRRAPRLRRPRRSPARDLPRRPAARPEVDAPALPDVPVPPGSHSQRAGWLGDRTGEFPTPVVDAPPAGTVNGGERTTHEVPAAPPAAPEPAPKGGLASRLGRNRNGSAAARNADAAPADPAPPATNGTRLPGRTPAAPTARTNDAGPVAEPPADAGRRRTGATPAPRRPDAAVPPAAPPRAGSPSGPAVPPAPATPSPFDDGRLGPPPVGRDTGQIRPVSGSALPPDLHWAADDTGNIPISGNVDSPFSGLSSLAPGGRPTPPPRADGEIAPHVAAMSPEARAAVQSTVGNAGGSGGARGGSQGEEIAQRGRLISFLSSVR